MSNVTDISYQHRLRCHVCKTNSFQIILDTEKFVNDHILVATDAICAECGEGWFDIQANHSRRKNLETQQR